MIQDPKMVWAAMYAASMGAAADVTDFENVQLAIRRANRAVANLREHGVFGETDHAEATGEQERLSAERKAWARLVRASRRNQQEDLGVSVEMADQDLRRLGVDVDTLLDEAT